MSVESNLRLPPFNLSDCDIAWVRKTRDGMSTAQKIRHLFVQMSMGDDPASGPRLSALQPGGVHRFMGPNLDAAWKLTRELVAASEIPLFITGDLEGGGNHASCFTHFPNQLGLSAANDLALSTAVVTAQAREARALGYNWTFTPCIDVNADPRSAIVGTRSFGSDTTRIFAQAKAHVNAMQSHGIAATAKHWPGEGYDARDQHLVTTINPLSVEDWHKVFGTLYKGLIDTGMMSVMSAHIALPSYAKAKGVADGLELFRPASLSRLLNMDLLRGELGFNGLIVSDATPMAGLTSFSARAEQVPQVIESGCDVFLFSPNEKQDIAFMEAGLRSGALSEQRLEDALTRILGMKAALGLHRMSLDERIPPLEVARAAVHTPSHIALAEEVSAKSVTLVKDVKNLLPLNPAKHRRITIIGRGAPGFIPTVPGTQMTTFRDELTARGFVVTPFDPANPPTPESTDLLIYEMAVESSLGKSRIFLDWANEQPGIMNLMSRYWHDVPTLLVSFGHPYYLYDAPRMPTLVNAYATTKEAQRAVAAKLTGNSSFEGSSPVDAFWGSPDARY